MIFWGMASTYYYLAAPREHEILAWFRSQSDPPEEYPKEEGSALYFRQFAALAPDANGGFDVSRSPVVTVVEPQVRRKALWSIGEVHFLAKNAGSTLPAFDRVRKRFQRWIRQYPVAWDRKNDGVERHGYFLEGGIKNIAEQVFVLPSASAALETGQYFVAHEEGNLDRICKTLRLRGVECD